MTLQTYTVVLVAALAAAAGCKIDCEVERRRSSAHAQIQCDVVAGPQVACTVRQVEGTADVEICWDFKVMCDSGASLTAPRSCVHVSPGETTQTTIPADKLTMLGTCTGDRHAELGALTIDGAPGVRGE